MQFRNYRVIWEWWKRSWKVLSLCSVKGLIIVYTSESNGQRTGTGDGDCGGLGFYGAYGYLEGRR